MASYYMLACYGTPPGNRAQVAVVPVRRQEWDAGRRFAKPVTEPVRATVINRGPMVSMFHGGGLLMTDKLVQALREAGVDNLDTYAAEIVNPRTKETWTNYLAVNIVGAVSAADMAKSATGPMMEDDLSPGLIDVPFEGVVIDEKRAGGMLMFRLAEAINSIVVHDNVKRQLEASGFEDLTFVEPEEWVA
jgi:hypothetical protein